MSTPPGRLLEYNTVCKQGLNQDADYIISVSKTIKFSSLNTLTMFFCFIGCGASCIYPILGCQINGWHYTTSEVDEMSLQYAKDNVERNNLQGNIKGKL